MTSVYQGEAEESDEVAPRWFGEHELPLSMMWDDAKYWLPLVLAGDRVDVLITFAEDCATVAGITPELPAGPRA